MFFYIDFYSQYEHINLTLIQHKQQQQQKSDEGVFIVFLGSASHADTVVRQPRGMTNS